ncbi:MAG: HAD family hydrolase [Erysipelotrichaceae bacterium]|nr:HAD family hydrolase [Erysipelotrichaceae bacterium]
MIRLLATDIDHTLYDANKKQISKRNLEAIAKLQQAGVMVVLASSRVFYGMQAIIEQLQLKQGRNFCIANNGAEIYQLDTMEKIADVPFSKEDLSRFYEFAKQYGLTYSICQDEYTLCTAINERLAYDYNNVGIDLCWVHDILNKVKKPAYHCSLTGDKDLAARAQKELSAQDQGRYFFNLPMPGYLDIAFANVNKGIGIQEIAKQLGLSKEEIASIGDGDNDVPMFEVSGLSACVANGSEYAKQEASIVVSNCSEDGFAEFVEEYILKGRENR